jgi:hypothetical protein
VLVVEFSERLSVFRGRVLQFIQGQTDFGGRAFQFIAVLNDFGGLLFQFIEGPFDFGETFSAVGGVLAGFSVSAPASDLDLPGSFAASFPAASTPPRAAGLSLKFQKKRGEP